MHLIELKIIQGEPVIVYAEVLSDVVKRPLNPQTGADIGEMRQSIRVLDAIDRANGILELEDADYDHLKQKLHAQPWNVIDRRIVQLIDDVDSA